MRNLLLLLIMWFASVSLAGAQIGIDSMPPERMQAVGVARAAIRSGDQKLLANAPAYVVDTHRWKPGRTVNIAFLGGNTELHKEIEKIAKEWTKYANIKFDFGVNSATGKYRKWSHSDTSYAAKIRISFDKPGYYSAVGTESTNPRLWPMNRESMNFDGFDVQYPNALPEDWEATILHEFGHALGLWHEHQKKICTDEIRWIDDGVYQSAYKYYLDNLNWPKEYTDSNLRPPPSADAVFGNVDSVNLESILMYRLPAEILINGQKSPCYVNKLPVVLSELDMQAARKAYPANPGTVTPMDSTKISKLLAFVARSDVLSIRERQALSEKIDSRIIADRPPVYIQVPTADLMESAIEVRQGLKAAGFIAPEIENIGKIRSPRRLEVRYFYSNDKSSAEEVAAAVALAQPSAVQPVIKLVKGYTGKIKRPQIEVWFPKPSQ